MASLRPCDVCGNEIAIGVTRCPFCESPLHSSSPAKARPRAAPAPAARPRAGRRGAPASGAAAGVARINLKQGMPTVAEALARLERALATHRLLGTPVLVVVHGYGSTGQGGAIGRAVRAQLRTLQAKGAVRSVVGGEEYTEFEEAARSLLERHPALQASFRTERGNRGITVLELTAGPGTRYPL